MKFKRDEMERGLLEILKSNGGRAMHESELERLLIHWKIGQHLKKMTQEGIIEKVREKGKKRLRISKTPNSEKVKE